jgi:hypothetical protein
MRGAIAARVRFILAREAAVGVIFRRGPADWVEIVRWDTQADTFEAGQWFHGRIYDRRCDLSPDGSLLIYFARKVNRRTRADHEYTYAWTAISRPPYLTALALWPKGDCWHGGGSFDSNGSIILNHEPDAATPHPKHVPQALHVRLKDRVYGEDDPIFSERLERDGWKLKQYARGLEVRQKEHPAGSQLLELTRSLSGYRFTEHFAVRQREDSARMEIERASWADWDSRGRLVFARDGKLYAATLTASSDLELKELLDLNGDAPASVRAPQWAVHW